MKKLLLIPIIFLLFSCVNQTTRLADCQKKYPKCVVQPATSLLKNQGYEIMVEDTIANQIYAVSYYPFSTSNISGIVNIK